MKRFIDLRKQNDIDYRFAWWDTIKDVFETHSGCGAWDTWKEFEMDYYGDQLERYKRLCPDWVFKSEEEE